MTPSELHKKCQSKLPPPHLYVIGVCVCARARVCTHVHKHIRMCRSEDNFGHRSQVPFTLLFETGSVTWLGVR